MEPIFGHSKLTVLIAAGARLWQEMLQTLVESESVEVIGACRHAAALRTLLIAHRPDLLLTRLPLEGVESPEALLQLRQHQPELGIVVILPANVDDTAVQSLAAGGAVALLTADTRGEEVRASLQLAAAGWTGIAPEVVRRTFGESVRRTIAARWITLSDRERLVLGQLACGTSEDDIAESMKVSIRTVQSLVARARDKLEAVDRTHAVAVALRAGLISGLAEED